MNWTREPLAFQEQQRLLSRLAEKVKVFHGLTPAELSELLARAEKCTFPPGAVIIHEGSIGQHMYLILDGDAVVTKKGASGEIELARLYAADSFGEMALADQETRSATVSALSPCILLRISEQALAAVRCEIAVKVYRNLARLLSERLRIADEALAWRL